MDVAPPLTEPFPLAPAAPAISRRRARRALFGWGALFGFLCLLMVVVALETALHFLGPAIDGPFQLYNSLRRIWVGQQAGVDFQFFHGLGIPYLHYIPFRLLGGTFIASEVTRELTSALLYPLVVIVVIRYFVRDWTRALAWSAIVMAGSIALRLTSMLVAINSLLGIRSSIPTILPVILCLRVRRPIRVALTGVALGLSLLMGTEQGLAAALAVVLATVVVAISNRSRAEYLVDAAAELGIAAVVLVATLTMLGGVAGMLGALTYNFKLVPMDQYWYFGSPPNLFISSWSILPKMMAVIPRIPIALLVGAIVAGLNARRLLRDADADGPRQREQFAFTVLAFYGLISCASLLGTYVNAYIQPLLRVLLLLSAIILDRRLPARDAALGRRPMLGMSRSVAFTAIGTLLLMIVVVPSVFVTTLVTVPHVIRDHVFRRVGAVYSGIWPETIISGEALLDAHRTPDGKPPTIWSTYAGLLEARNGLFHPSFDYVIHALGPENRQRYVDDFRRLRPELVQTVLPTYTQFEPWIEGTSWDFYAEVLRDYKVIGGTPWSLFWERLPTPGPSSPVVWSTNVAPSATSVDLPAAPGDGGLVLMQAELTYSVRNPLHVLPIVGSLPRYLVSLDNAIRQDPISIDPYTTTTRIPVLGVRGKSVRLRWEVKSLLPGASITVSKVTLSFVPVSNANAYWLDNLADREFGKSPNQ